MKNLLLALVVLLSISVEVEAAPEAIKKTNCRLDLTSTINDTAPVATLKADILQGVWLKKLAHSKIEVIYRFHTFGTLDQTVVYEDGHTSTSRLNWHLEEDDGLIFMVIEDADLGEDLYFAIEQSCDGLILTDTISFEETTLFFKPKASKTTISNISSMILGQWQHEGNPFKATYSAESKEMLDAEKAAFFNYDFNKNGTFARTLGKNGMEVNEKGFWLISDDADFLILQLSKDGKRENVYTSQYVRLHYIDAEHLQIEQSLTINGKQKKALEMPAKMFVFKKSLLTVKGMAPN